MSTVSGPFLKDGTGTTISFSVSQIGVVRFSELALQPPGFQAGGGINTTGTRNVRVRTQQSKKLLTVASSKGTVKYSPLALTDAYTLIGKNGLITVTHPDGATTAAWGWLDEFVPNENSDGELPVADIVIEWSNENDTGVETPPITTAAVVP